MPSITTSYLYSFAAVITVSGLLITAFMSYIGGIRFASEANELKNIVDSVAARATELLALTSVSNCTAETYADVPTSIGSMQYWLRLRNSSSQAWVEGGFGRVPHSESVVEAYVPRDASASGFYAAGDGILTLASNAENGVLNIRMGSLHGAD